MTAVKSPDVSDREIVQTRTFNAPRELVFEVYTSPKHIDHWWGPRGFTNKTHEMSVTPGGRWVFDMVGPDGKVWDNRIVYLEVKRPERLVFNHGSNRDNDPDVFHVEVTFEDLGNGKTRFTQRMVFKSKESCDEKKAFGAVELGAQTFDKLAEYLVRVA